MKRSTVSVWSMVVCSGLMAGLAVSQPNAPQPQPQPQPVQPAKPPAPAPVPRPVQPVVRPTPAPAPPAEVSPEMKAMMEAGAPDDHHKKLEAFIGFWDGTMKVWMDPAKEPTETKSSIIARWDAGMDGRFLAMDHRGMLMNMPFRGNAIWGFNKATKKYESVWHDNFGTGIMISYGEMSPDSKTLNFTGEYDDPAGSGKIKTRELYTWENAESFKFEMFETRPGGKEAKSLEATFSRRTTQVRPGGVKTTPPEAPIAKPDAGKK